MGLSRVLPLASRSPFSAGATRSAHEQAGVRCGMPEDCSIPGPGWTIGSGGGVDLGTSSLARPRSGACRLRFRGDGAVVA